MNDFSIKLSNTQLSSTNHGTHWRLTLRCEGRRMTCKYWQGSAHKSTPVLSDVLTSLQLDARCGEGSFAEFLSEFGEHPSETSEATWKACRKQRAKLMRLLGSEFERFMSEDFERAAISAA